MPQGPVTGCFASVQALSAHSHLWRAWDSTAGVSYWREKQRLNSQK